MSCYQSSRIVAAFFKVEEQEQGSVVSLSKEEQQRDRRTKMVKRGVFERVKLQVNNHALNCDMTEDEEL